MSLLIGFFLVGCGLAVRSAARCAFIYQSYGGGPFLLLESAVWHRVHLRPGVFSWLSLGPEPCWDKARPIPGPTSTAGSRPSKPGRVLRLGGPTLPVCTPNQSGSARAMEKGSCCCDPRHRSGRCRVRTLQHHSTRQLDRNAFTLRRSSLRIKPPTPAASSARL